jgi:hypothetical protein
MTTEEKATQREIERMEPVESYIRETLSGCPLDDHTKTLIAGHLRNFWWLTLCIGGRIELEGWGPSLRGIDLVRASPYDVLLDFIVNPRPNSWLHLERRGDQVVATTMAGDADAGAAQEMITELYRARCHGDRFASLHEAYAVVLEELDEIWEIVRMKCRDRDGAHLRKEFVQLGAMAMKALLSLENFTGGSV